MDDRELSFETIPCSEMPLFLKRFQVRRKIQEKAKDGTLQTRDENAEVSQVRTAPKRKGRWDQTSAASEEAAAAAAAAGGAPAAKTTKKAAWEAETPAHDQWGATPGHRGAGGETPGATPGQSTRMWDATPGHATPGHGGSEKIISSARRNRWDETPKTDRGGEL
jgi:splicing factor 3B subunit 1